MGSLSDPPKFTQYAHSTSTRILSAMQESLGSVHAAFEVKHAYLRQAVEQLGQ